MRQEKLNAFAHFSVAMVTDVPQMNIVCVYRIACFNFVMNEMIMVIVVKTMLLTLFIPTWQPWSPGGDIGIGRVCMFVCPYHIIS